MSKIKLSSNASGTGNVTVSSPATNSDRTITFPDGDGAMPLIKLETAKTATGTAVDFTGIPSWVKRITVMFNGVSTNGTSSYQILLGDSGGIETSGYSGTFVNNAVTSSAANIMPTSGFSLGTPTAANTFTGAVSLCNISSSIWVINGFIAGATAGYGWSIGGSKTLSDTLTQIRITTANGTDTFDAGTINIMYEG
jgi:hypothetical protein